MRTRQVRSPWRIVRCKKIAKRRPQRGRLFCCEFRRAAQRYKFARTNAEWHAPVGADASVRPAVCTHENECTDAIAYTVCRGRCPHRPARRTSVFTIRCGKTVVPIGRTEASAPTGRCAFSPKMRAILRLHPAGESAASTPTDILRCRRSLCVFDCAFCAGGASPSPTLRRNVATAQKQGLFSSSVTFGDSFPSRGSH